MIKIIRIIGKKKYAHLWHNAANVGIVGNVGTSGSEVRVFKLKLQSHRAVCTALII